MDFHSLTQLSKALHVYQETLMVRRKPIECYVIDNANVPSQCKQRLPSFIWRRVCLQISPVGETIKQQLDEISVGISEEMSLLTVGGEQDDPFINNSLYISFFSNHNWYSLLSVGTLYFMDSISFLYFIFSFIANPFEFLILL